MSVEAVAEYINSGFPKVEGWLSGHILHVVACLGEEMNKLGVVGGACEIGVFMGKFIIGLSHAVDARPSLAIDIFDHQEHNVDNSGGGHANLFATFESNVAAYGNSSLVSKVADSFSLTILDQSEILKTFGPFQFFSIDGGHEAEHVINDYRFAEAVTHPGGAIIIDDILNPGWLGVIEGVARLYLLDTPKFLPLLIGHNKLILVGKSYHRRYLDIAMERLPRDLPSIPFSIKTFFGYDLIEMG